MMKRKGKSMKRKVQKNHAMTTGEYKKSEDGDFLPTEGSPYILLTPKSCDLYMITNYNVNYIMKHLILSGPLYPKLSTCLRAPS